MALKFMSVWLNYSLSFTYYKNNKEKFDFIKYSIEDDRPKTFL